MIKDFTPRIYQEKILATAVDHNTLVVIPTGLGKTSIALLLAEYRLTNFPKSKVVFLAPTKPLAEQHLQYFKKHLTLDDDQMVLFTGFVKPEKRAELWKEKRIIFSTPQGLENDVISGKISMNDVSLMIFDEAHRAVGDYSYVFIAKQYYKKADYPKILGLTASPGVEVEKVKEVCTNLSIEEIEVRTDADPDVVPYIKEIKIEWVTVELPLKFREIQKYLDAILKKRLEQLRDWGVVKRTQTRYLNRKEILSLQGEMHARIAQGEKSPEIWHSLSKIAELMKVHHGLELLETQGISALYLYLKKIRDSADSTKVKAVKNLVLDPDFKSAFILTEKLYELKIEHPKVNQLVNLVKSEISPGKNFKIIVFNQYRDSASKIEEELNLIDGITARLFVGQVKKGDTGLSQKKQIEMLDSFRRGDFNVLVSTAVGEEGIDIPQVDLVVFYEPIPSAIRHIQRRGRTGRLEEGRMIVLMAKDTRDEAYRWVAHRKEKKMHQTLHDLKSKIKLENFGGRDESQHSLDKYVEKKIMEKTKLKIFADVREKASSVIKELIDMEVQLELKTLDVGDYQLSERSCVEFKTVPDFVDSIVDGRLLGQVKNLKQGFQRPVIIVEGIGDLYVQRKVHPNAIRGMLATIAVSFGVPILMTRDHKETAGILYAIAKREQQETDSDFNMHKDKKPLTLKEQQEYIVSSLPGVGSTLSKPLLKKFKSVKNVVNADLDELKEVDLIGDKKAKAIKDVVDKDYED